MESPTTGSDPAAKRAIPTLNPAQRRAWPILAAALDCFRELEPGEAYIDFSTGRTGVMGAEDSDRKKSATKERLP